MQEIEWPRLPGESEIDQRVRMLLWCIRMVESKGRPVTHEEVYQYQRGICGYDRMTTSAGLEEISRRGYLWQQIHHSCIPWSREAAAAYEV